MNDFHLPESGNLGRARSAFTRTLQSLEREVVTSGGG